MNFITSITRTIPPFTTRISKLPQNPRAEAEARADFIKTLNEAEARRKEYFITKAKLEGVGIVHIFDTFYPKGGMTIAFKKSNPYKSGIMVDVAVNNCSLEDTFSRSHGTVSALEKFFEGKSIQLPLLRFHDERDLPGVIKKHFRLMFT